MTDLPPIVWKQVEGTISWDGSWEDLDARVGDRIKMEAFVGNQSIGWFETRVVTPRRGEPLHQWTWKWRSRFITSQSLRCWRKSSGMKELRTRIELPFRLFCEGAKLGRISG